MPDLIRQSITKYKDSLLEWKEASLKYQRGKSYKKFINLQVN